MIGHNLEGFYTIRFNATIMKTIYCDFYGKIANKINPTTVTLPTTKLTTTLKSGIKSKSAIFILSLRPLSVFNVSCAGADFKVVRTLSLDHYEGKSYPLMNKHGMCLAVETVGKLLSLSNGTLLLENKIKSG